MNYSGIKKLRLMDISYCEIKYQNMSSIKKHNKANGTDNAACYYPYRGIVNPLSFRTSWRTVLYHFTDLTNLNQEVLS